MQFAFFETALRAQKSYSRLMEPVCKKWNLTHNELDVLLFLANNPEPAAGSADSAAGSRWRTSSRSSAIFSGVISAAEVIGPLRAAAVA